MELESRFGYSIVNFLEIRLKRKEGVYSWIFCRSDTVSYAIKEIEDIPDLILCTDVFRSTSYDSCNCKASIKMHSFYFLMKETFVSLIINFITVIKVWSGKGLVND